MSVITTAPARIVETREEAFAELVSRCSGPVSFELAGTDGTRRTIGCFSGRPNAQAMVAEVREQPEQLWFYLAAFTADTVTIVTFSDDRYIVVTSAR